jgi:hypothetical protein
MIVIVALLIEYTCAQHQMSDTRNKTYIDEYKIQAKTRQAGGKMREAERIIGRQLRWNVRPLWLWRIISIAGSHSLRSCAVATIYTGATTAIAPAVATP